MPSGVKVLIVEDEYTSALVLRMQLEKLGYVVLGTHSRGEDAVLFMETHEADVILMDINLAGSMDGIEAARLIKEKRDIPIIFVTGYSDPDVRERAESLNPAGFIIKPVNAQILQAHIRTIR